ncbi:MAG: hypothetical protein IAE78_12825 [Myxococcus sp.]|nr:hypothetical protein [Myxococcus sp.]
MSQTLFERVRALHAAGQSAEAIEATLRAEGHSAEDITVLLGSVGAGPQPRPDPTKDTAPLTTLKRIANSKWLKGLAVLVFVGALTLAAAVAVALLRAFQALR